MELVLVKKMKIKVDYRKKITELADAMVKKGEHFVSEYDEDINDLNFPLDSIDGLMKFDVNIYLPKNKGVDSFTTADVLTCLKKEIEDNYPNAFLGTIEGLLKIGIKFEHGLIAFGSKLKPKDEFSSLAVPAISRRCGSMLLWMNDYDRKWTGTDWYVFLMKAVKS